MGAIFIVIVPLIVLILWIPGKCNDFVVMFSGMDE